MNPVKETKTMKYVTNKGGATHQVNDAHAKELLEGNEGFREATPEEVTATERRYGLVLPPKKEGEDDHAYLNRLKYGHLIKVATEGGIEVEEDTPREDLIAIILDEIKRKAKVEGKGAAPGPDGASK